MYFDAHSHLHGKEYDLDREEVLARMNEQQVETIVVGTDREESAQAVAFATNTQGVWATIGQHPVGREEEIFDVSFYKTLAESKKVVAIGECGLDYFRTDPAKLPLEKERQKKLFIEQVELAALLNLPLMIHCRPSIGTMDAHEELVSILKEYVGRHKAHALRGNIHFFTGTLAVAREYLELEFTLSFPGIITFAHEYDEVIKEIPATSIISETDSPYATPVPYRGKRNEPTFVIETVKRIAELRGQSLPKMSEQIRLNVNRVFGI
jgi:TatD DNase family protein